MEFMKPPPVRRLDLEHAPEAKEAPERHDPPARNGNGNGSGERDPANLIPGL